MTDAEYTEYMRTQVPELEVAISKAMSQAIKELSPDPVLRVAELLKETRSAHAPKKPLAELVAAWQRTQPKAADGESAVALNAKFASSGESFEFTYAGVEQFFAGLEGLVGPPSPDVMEAMAREHASKEQFEAWNADVQRITCPKDEWAYVAEGVAGTTGSLDGDSPESSSGRGRGRTPSHAMDGSGQHAGWRLADFAKQERVQKAGLLLAEVAGVRLYTGPMYVHYNKTLRNRIAGIFVTTLHAINSGIIKLSKLTPAVTVYRGVSGGVLPQQFWTPNEHGVMGGVELGFMSTTTERSVALGYMKQSGKRAQMMFEIRMGMIDRGADVSMLSQFPGEKEILFAPSKALELAKMLLKANADPNKATSDGLLTLQQTDSKDMVELLLAHGAKLDEVSSRGNAALIVAASDGCVDVATALLTAGAALDVADWEGDTALLLAIRNEHTGIAEALVAAGADVNLTNADGQTALHWAVGIGDAGKSTIELLLANGADREVVTKRGNTPLVHAVKLNNEAAAMLLLKHGADPDKTDKDGNTMLMIARGNENTALCEALQAKLSQAAVDSDAKPVEPEAVTISGEWEMVSDSGSKFRYAWEHNAGSESFSGSQIGYNSIRDAEIDPSTWLVKWTVGDGDEAVTCQGTLDPVRLAITDGRFWMTVSGAPLGSFSGRKIKKVHADV